MGMTFGDLPPQLSGSRLVAALRETKHGMATAAADRIEELEAAHTEVRRDMSRAPDAEDAGCGYSIWVQRAGDLYWRDGKQYPYKKTMVAMCDTDHEIVRRFASSDEVETLIAELRKAATTAWPAE